MYLPYIQAQYLVTPVPADGLGHQHSADYKLSMFSPKFLWLMVL